MAVRAGLVSLVLLLACGPSRSERPNAVLVVLDTTRADVLSAYGNPAPTSPRIDRLAREGALFRRVFATDFWTLPSHASLFTGRYPSEHGATEETNRLPDDEQTLAETFRGAGYRTAAFVTNPWLRSESGFAQGFEVFEEMWRGKTLPGLADREGIAGARRFIEERAAAAEPFFLFVNLNSPHLPYRPDPLALDAVVSRGHSAERTRRLAFVVGEWEHMAGAYALDAEDFEVMRDLYRGEIRGVDAFVGSLVDTLSASGVLDRTVVVVTSDHGENLGERGRIGHVLSMYDTTLHVPLVARYPARIAPGTVVDDLASGVDVAPTILDAAGLEAPPSSGRSLLDAARPPPAFVVAENDRPLNGIRLLRSKFPDFDTSGVDGRMRMLRSDRYKLIWHEVHGVELYDLESDPEELHDLSDSRPELREALLGQLEPWLEPGPERGDEPVDPLESLDPEAREQLRALGYVH